MSARVWPVLRSSNSSRTLARRGSPPADAADPLYPAIAAGLAAGRSRHRIPAQTRARAREIRDTARTTGNRAAAVPELLLLIEEYPRAEEIQKIVARLLHEMHESERALAAWLGIAGRFPASMDAFLTLVRLTYRQRGPDAARVAIQARFPKVPDDFDQLVAYAEAYHGIGATAEGDIAFDRLSRLFEKRSWSWLKLASSLEAGGVSRLPGKVLRWVGGRSSLARPFIREIHYIDKALEESEVAFPRDAKKSLVGSVRVLEALFDRVLASRPPPGENDPKGYAPVVLLTGSLGSGGAERQVVNTAIGLCELGGLSGRCSPERGQPVSVLARSLRERIDAEFFLPELRRAGISVSSYRDLPDFNGSLQKSAVRPILNVLRFLPWQIIEGVIKVTDVLRTINPTVVHIWQDGLIYATGLAALLAGIPRIILNPRSVPPPDRRRYNWVEYGVIYRSLMRAPGVRLAVNSHHSADRYAAWLGIDRDQIAVIANGVARPRSVPDAGAEAMFRAFEARTGAAFTLGTVMRLDDNKRPLLWIDSALKLLSVCPAARFIVVGDGPQRAKAIQRAEMNGAANRFLFVGRSACVGYWLKRMDAFMLLSEHEGLPNVLIEAQLVGVPVITSPAGGAPETLVPGITGIVTSKSPTPPEVAELVANLIAEGNRLDRMAVAAEKWASETFPVSQMLTKTIELYVTAGRNQAARPGAEGAVAH